MRRLFRWLQGLGLREPSVRRLPPLQGLRIGAKAVSEMLDYFARKDAGDLARCVRCGCVTCMGKARHNFAAADEIVKETLRRENPDAYRTLRTRNE